MQSLWFFPLLAFLHLSFPEASSAYIEMGGGVGVWINGRGVTVTTGPQPSPPSNSDLSPSREYAALQAWKSAITEDPSGILTSWLGPNVCSYRGIYCSDPPEAEDVPSSTTRSVVAGIDLNRANLRGSLVKELSLLTHLSIIHLNSNRFSGTVPDSFREFQYLSELDLSNNLLSGSFPTQTLLIPNLKYLDLRFNSFLGEVPDEVFEKDLDAIFLNNNQFEGQIPMSIWGTPATVITLANNKFSGSLPASFGYTGAGIREILFLNNKLTGCIPEGLGYLSEMEVLDLSTNSITGHLPGSLSCLTGMEVLNIAHNQLTGELSDLVCDLKNLANLTVSYNFFSGFSQDCAKLIIRNAGFEFYGNCIPGRGMQRPPSECMGVPVGDLSCLRIPTTKPVACAAGAIMGQVGRMDGIPFNLPASLPSTVP